MADIRYALRTLLRSPGYTITCLAVLALAIGANTAMFSVLNAVLLRPLPYPSPAQLAMVWAEIPSQNIREGRSAYWNVEQLRRQTRSFSEIAVFDPVSSTLTSADGAERIGVVRASPNLLGLLGVQPLLGRMFTAEEADQRQRLVLISHQFWQTRFGGSHSAIGASIELDGARSQVIGILPAGFQFPGGDVWEAHTMFPDWETRRGARGPGSWFVLGRLRPGIAVERAQAEMSAIALRLNEQLPASERNRGISVVPLSEHLTGPKTRLALWMLTGAVLCVLLIAASNIASLSLARTAGRQREIAVRAALGASRSRIIRQLLAESLTLGAMAGVASLFVAWACIRLILVLKPVDVPRLDEAGIDPRVFGISAALCLLTGIVVGLAPALTVARSSLNAGQAGGRGTTAGLATRGIRRALVVGQFALAIVLLFGAGLLIRSLRSAENVALGFRPDHVLSAQIATPSSIAASGRVNFYGRVLEEIESLPGVDSAGVIENLFTASGPEQMVTPEGSLGTVRLRFRSDGISGGFFKALGTPLLRGRIFSRDDGNSGRVAIINEAMARRLWPAADPVGKRFKPGAADSNSPWFTVVGLVGDMRRQGLEREPIPQMFEPLVQDPPRLATLLIRTPTNDPLTMTSAVQAAVRRVEKHVPVYDVTTLETRLGGFLTQRRFQTSILVSFSVVAMLMACIGIYGLIQYSVAKRTNEIGIRLAVGAQSRDIFTMMIREGLRLSLTGLAIGLAGALWLGRAASSLLFGVTATDPFTLVAVSLLLTAVAAAACYFPARRAMKVDPIAALRHE